MNYRILTILIVSSSISLSLYPAQKTKKSVIEKAQEALDEITEGPELAIDLKKNGINAENKFHMSVLDIAAKHQDLFPASLVEDLINFGANVHHTDATDATPLHTAAAHGNLPCMELLIEHGADVNATVGRSRVTPLDDVFYGYRYSHGYSPKGEAPHSYYEVEKLPYGNKISISKYYDAVLLLLKAVACVSEQTYDLASKYYISRDVTALIEEYSKTQPCK